MKIGLLIKPVPDTETRIKIAGDSLGIDESDIKFVPNPYDEYAYEEALKLNEAIGEGEVVAITVAGEEGKNVLKKAALAVGCHRAIHVMVDKNQKPDAFQTASLIAKIIEEEKFDIVFSGKQAIDLDQSLVPFHVAELMKWPIVPAITSFKLADDKSSVIVERVTDEGKEVIESKIPVLLTTTKGLNDPRYAKLKGIMAAKKKPMAEKIASELGIPEAATKIVKVSSPPSRKAPKIIDGEFPENVNTLVELLHNEAKII